MRYLLILSFSVLSTVSGFSQFGIGHKTVTYNDAARTGGFGSGGGAGRQIQCEIYYPATTTGDNAVLESGEFPIITFGHGFVMAWDAYQNIWENFVPQGYIFIFPRTEGGFSPNHNEYALDLHIASERFKTDAQNSLDFFFDAYNGKCAVMGHSMGGGAATLATSMFNADFDLYVGLAPAETTPSAITAAATIATPTIIFSGSGDAVTPPAANHQPIYDAIPNGICKQFISITGGGHCFFALANGACDFGENSSGSTTTITRPEQHDITFDNLNYALDFYLQEDCAAWDLYINQINTDTRIVKQNSCSYTAPANPVVMISTTYAISNTGTNIQWYDDNGPIAGETNDSLNMTTYGTGNYYVVQDNSVCQSESNVVNFVTASLDAFEIEKIIIYPNPVKDWATIKGLDNEKINFIGVYDVSGKKLDTTIDGNKIYMGDLDKGIYFVRIEYLGLTKVFELVK